MVSSLVFLITSIHLFIATSTAFKDGSILKSALLLIGERCSAIRENSALASSPRIIDGVPEAAPLDLASEPLRLERLERGVETTDSTTVESRAVRMSSTNSSNERCAIIRACFLSMSAAPMSECSCADISRPIAYFF